MEMQDDQQTLLEKAWKDFNELKRKKEAEEEEVEKNEDYCINTCCEGNKDDLITDQRTADTICTLCGTIQYKLPSDIQEWNDYSDEGGGFSGSKSRCAYVGDYYNPYATFGSKLPKNLFTTQKMPDGTWKNVNLSRLYSGQMNMSHKEKSFMLVSNLLKDAADRCGIKKNVLQKAEDYWNRVVKSGKLLRGSPRKGIIASCLIYACNINNIPYDSKVIAAAFGMETKEITRGEKIFRELFEGTDVGNIIYSEINTQELFSRYINLLKIPYSLFSECIEKHEKCKKYLDDVNLKSQTAGVLVHIIKNVHKMKNPTKTIISKKLNICNPTINKVVKKIVKIEKFLSK